MKRMVIVIFMLAGILFLSVVSARVVESVRFDIDLYVGEILTAYEISDQEQLLEKVDNLSDYWPSAESKMLNYVHRDLVDSLGHSISQLYPLAEYESWALFHAEIMSIYWQIENIRRFENFSFLNIF